MQKEKTFSKIHDTLRHQANLYSYKKTEITT